MTGASAIDLYAPVWSVNILLFVMIVCVIGVVVWILRLAANE